MGIGMIVNCADMDVDGFGECSVGTGAGGVDGLGVQGVGEGGVGVVGCGCGRRWHGQHGYGYG